MMTMKRGPGMRGMNWCQRSLKLSWPEPEPEPQPGNLHTKTAAMEIMAILIMFDDHVAVAQQYAAIGY